MAVLYVNSITGDDGNSGASWDLAKQTLAAAKSAATASDTIYCHGRFAEAITTDKTITWVGVGYCVLDGENTIANLVIMNATGTGSSFRGFTITRATNAGVYNTTNNTTCYFYDCVISNNAYGFYNPSFNTIATWYLFNCQILNNSWAGVYVGTGTVYLDNVVIYSTLGYGIFNPHGNFNVVIINNSAIDCPVLIRSRVSGQILTNGHPNAYALRSGGNVFQVDPNQNPTSPTDYTTLATFAAAAASTLATNGIEYDWMNDAADETNGIYAPTPAAYLLTAGVGGTPVGYIRPAVALSNSVNASLWTGGVFSNTEIDGSGYLVLSAGQTSGYWRSDIIDLGAAIDAYSIQISSAGEDATNFVDYDTGDSPGYFNVRVRGSNASFAKGDTSPAWVTMPRGDEIGDHMSTALRYWQVELMLRG